jgi:exonuclease III
MDPTKILIWNVRGLNSTARQDSVRSLVVSSRADIVCIQETKMTAISQRIKLSTLGSDFTGYITLPSIGANGGIFVAWRRHIGITGAQRVDSFSTSIQFSTENGQAWWLTCVYGPQGTEDNSVSTGASRHPGCLPRTLVVSWGFQFDLQRR